MKIASYMINVEYADYPTELIVAHVEDDDSITKLFLSRNGGESWNPLTTADLDEFASRDPDYPSDGFISFANKMLEGEPTFEVLKDDEVLFTNKTDDNEVAIGDLIEVEVTEIGKPLGDTL